MRNMLVRLCLRIMFCPVVDTPYVVFNTFATYVVSVVKLKYVYDVCVVNVVKGDTCDRNPEPEREFALSIQPTQN